MCMRTELRILAAVLAISPASAVCSGAETHRSRAFRRSGLEVTCSEQQVLAHVAESVESAVQAGFKCQASAPAAPAAPPLSMDGALSSPACNPAFYPGGDVTRHAYDLQFSGGSDKLVRNNLGGQGPNNCCLPGPAHTCNPTPDQGCSADPPFIEIRDVTSHAVDGSSVHLRIFNASEYKPADFGVDENRLRFMSGSEDAGFLQPNLRPVFNERTSPYATGREAQPFKSELIEFALSLEPLVDFLANLLPDLGSNIYDARFTNIVTLFYLFTDEDGAAVELDEFIVSFFDFDQAYADGADGLVRESLLIYDFETMFIDE